MQINYVVARYWPSEPQRLSAYMIHNAEVQFGTMEDAKTFLKYVRKQNPDDHWKIFQLVSVMEDLHE